MRSVVAHGFAVAPAAGALGARGADDAGAGFVAGDEGEIAEDEEFLELGFAILELGEERFISNLQGDGAFERVADELLRARSFDGLADSTAELEQLFEVRFERFVAELGIWLGKELEVDDAGLPKCSTLRRR